MHLGTSHVCQLDHKAATSMHCMLWGTCRGDFELQELFYSPSHYITSNALARDDIAMCLSVLTPEREGEMTTKEWLASVMYVHFSIWHDKF